MKFKNWLAESDWHPAEFVLVTIILLACVWLAAFDQGLAQGDGNAANAIQVYKDAHPFADNPSGVR